MTVQGSSSIRISSGMNWGYFGSPTRRHGLPGSFSMNGLLKLCESYLTLQHGDLNSTAVSLVWYSFQPGIYSDREVIYSSLFLKYMRYKHETFY
jgi:hypothetical protein